MSINRYKGVYGLLVKGRDIVGRLPVLEQERCELSDLHLACCLPRRSVYTYT